MGERAGAGEDLSAIVTREVRWFFEGGIPRWFTTWFGSLPGPLYQEFRSDVYDLEAAHQNVGLKRRSPANTLDCKMMLASQEEVELGSGIQGDLEDWIKISQPLGESTHGPGRAEVLKRTMAKRFFLDTSTGCEAEVADITVGHIVAWTLCLETFGEAELRDLAMSHGLEAMFDATELPTGLILSSATSHSYPEWLALQDSLGGLGGEVSTSRAGAPQMPDPEHESQAS